MRLQNEEHKHQLSELKRSLKSKDQEMQKLRAYIETYEEDAKKLQEKILDLTLQVEEMKAQNESNEEKILQAERQKTDHKNLQNQAIKKMEQECDEKDQQIRKLKEQLKQLRVKSMENENVLRDELDQLSEKNKKLLKVEATVEVLQNKLKELPELRNKLRMTMEANIKLEET